MRYFNINQIQQKLNEKQFHSNWLLMENNTRLFNPQLEERYKKIQQQHNTQCFTDQKGYWDTGPDGSFICMYIQKAWEKNHVLISRIFDAFDTALKVPNGIAKYMQNKQFKSQGMNYLSKEEQVGEALKSLGFIQADFQNIKKQLQGTIDKLEYEYFLRPMSLFRVNFSPILPYLTTGMKSFQKIASDSSVDSSVKQNNINSASQVIVVITAIVFGYQWRVVMGARWNTSSYQTSKQVVKVKCGSTKIEHISANYRTVGYIHKDFKYPGQQQICPDKVEQVKCLKFNQEK